MNIVWDNDAKKRLEETLTYCIDTFGLKVAKVFLSNIGRLEKRLILNPDMGHPEPLLAGKSFIYRAVIVQKNFKLIYRIDEGDELIFIADFWDTRREPSSLIRKFE